MDVLEVTVAEHGRIVIPKQARDALGIKPGTRLELRLIDGTLVIAKRVRLNLSKWIGSARDDGLTTHEALQELRGRPEPWKGRNEANQAIVHRTGRKKTARRSQQ